MTPTNTKPLNKEHAVQEVIFSLQLSEKITPASVQKLIELKEILKNDLPKQEELRLLSFQFSTSQPVSDFPLKTPEDVLAGIILKHTNENEIPDWTVRAEQNMIIVNCLDYKGWEKNWPKALTYLETLAEQVINENPIKAINLQYTNIFESSLKENYNLNEIFSETSPYLTENIKKGGHLWHLFQGWLEDDAILKSKCLNNLNLATSIKNQELITTVTILRQAQIEDPLQGLSKLDFIMNQLHIDLKKVLTTVLASKMAERIGLTNA